MTTKSILYTTIILFGSLFLPLNFLNENSSNVDFILVIYILTLIISPFIFALIFDPLIYLWKKHIRKKDLIKPFSKGTFNDFVENVFAYWIVILVLNLILKII